MDLDGTRGYKGALTMDERRRRSDAGLCAYCGQPGHTLATCTLASRSRQVPTSTSPSSPPRIRLPLPLQLLLPPLLLLQLLSPLLLLQLLPPLLLLRLLLRTRPVTHHSGTLQPGTL